MALRLTPLDARTRDRDALIRFMTEHQWPFHVMEHPSRNQIEENINDGAYDDADHASFWIDDDVLGRVGYARLEDLTDNAPMFDLRLDPRFRGKGLAPQVLAALTREVFARYPSVTRFEGKTREDNMPMRRVFVREGWVKEAHYREAWPVADGSAKASVAYSILRRDWESGTTTPVDWDDMGT